MRITRSGWSGCSDASRLRSRARPPPLPPPRPMRSQAGCSSSSKSARRQEGGQPPAELLPVAVGAVGSRSPRPRRRRSTPLRAPASKSRSPRAQHPPDLAALRWCVQLRTLLDDALSHPRDAHAPARRRPGLPGGVRPSHRPGPPPGRCLPLHTARRRGRGSAWISSPPTAFPPALPLARIFSFRVLWIRRWRWPTRCTSRRWFAARAARSVQQQPSPFLPPPRCSQRATSLRRCPSWGSSPAASHPPDPTWQP